MGTTGDTQPLWAWVPNRPTAAGAAENAAGSLPAGGKGRCDRLIPRLFPTLTLGTPGSKLSFLSPKPLS